MDENITPLLADADTSGQGASCKVTLILNVGGVTFETYRSTLLRLPNSRLNNRDFLEEHYRPERKDYFFDRDPDAFKIVLNYLRTGHLYVPTYCNHPSVGNELLFWGLTAAEIGQAGNVGFTQVTHNVVVKPGCRNAALADNNSTKIWNILSDPATSLLAKIYAALSYVLICVSIFILVFETTSLFRVKDRADHISGNATTYSPWLSNIEKSEDLENHYSVYIIVLVIQLFFTAEYILRFVCAPRRITYVFSFLGGIDLLALVVDYFLLVTTIYGGDSGSFKLIRIMRVFRILRILRVFKHFKNLMKTEVITCTLKTSAGELVLVASLFLIGTLVSGTTAHALENENIYSNFESIPEACWWAVITMTTVGYGDVIPVTTPGQILSSFSALYGLTMIGLVVSVLVNNLSVCSKDLKNQHKCNGSGSTVVE